MIKRVEILLDTTDDSITVISEDKVEYLGDDMYFGNGLPYDLEKEIMRGLGKAKVKE